MINLLFLIPTAIYGFVFYKQYTIVLQSQKNDPYFKTKALFLLHTVFNITGIWLLLYRQKIPALICFTIVSLVALYAYTKQK